MCCQNIPKTVHLIYIDINALLIWAVIKSTEGATGRNEAKETVMIR